jgi:virginiamycin B lyase
MRPLITLAGAAALFGATTAALAQQQSGGPPVEANFPDGPGKQTVIGVCGSCHDLVRLTAGYTPEGWLSVTAMMRNFGAPVPAEEWDTVRAYLIRSFAERPRPEARLLSGPAQVFIMQWPLPTPGSRPHDPMVAHDGAIWWTGQLANKLGRLDPQSGQMREYPVNAQSRTASSRTRTIMSGSPVISGALSAGSTRAAAT